MEQARAQLNSSWPQLLEATLFTPAPGQRRQSFLAMRLEFESAATGITTALRSHFVQPLLLLMGIGGLILMVVCVNLTSLTLARAASREHEVSTRLALGATVRQIVRQLITESILLSTAGAMLALVFAYWGSQFVVGSYDRRSPRSSRA